MVSGVACCPQGGLQHDSSSACFAPQQVALDQLGFSPCFHARFMPYFSDLYDAIYAHALGRAGFPARELFRRFNAAVDIPAPLIPLVMEAYPDAKVGKLTDPITVSPRHLLADLWPQQTCSR